MRANYNSGFTRLEKLMNNILVLKVIRIIKKLLYFKKKNLGVSLTGFTLIEAMAVIVIIGLISVFFVINMKPDQFALLKMDTTRLAADIRYIRSMATTRATYNGSYPADGYGIIFYNGTGTGDEIINYSRYEIKAGSTVLKTVYLANVAFRFVDPNLEYPTAINITTPKKFFFKTENSVESDLKPSTSGEYKIDIYYAYTTKAYYKSQITIGQKTSDEFTWSNLATTYDTNDPVCRNGVVELGEECERYEPRTYPTDPLILRDAGCLLNCRSNQCGDGIILGKETCETTIGGSDYYCPNWNWAMNCSSLSGCQTISDVIIEEYGEQILGKYIAKSCCTIVTSYCVDCKRQKVLQICN